MSGKSTEAFEKHELDRIIAAAQSNVLHSFNMQRNIDAAFESLFAAEKHSRLQSDNPSNTAIVLACLSIAVKHYPLEKLLEVCSFLIKKRGFVKESIRALFERLLDLAKDSKSVADKASLCRFVVDNSEGKIFCEVERARTVAYLSHVFEKEGRLSEACDLILGLQVETFGSVERGEKLNFLLEQMRFAIAKGEFSHAQIISRKISRKILDESCFSAEREKYYRMMLQIAAFFEDFENSAEYFRCLAAKSPHSLHLSSEAAVFEVLVSYSNAQESRLKSLLSHFDRRSPTAVLVNQFLASEIIDFDVFCRNFGSFLSESFAFSPNSKFASRNFDALKLRIMEHNIRVLSLFFEQIAISDASAILKMDTNETEVAFCKMISALQIQAKIDRMTGIVQFYNVKNSSDNLAVLSTWSSSINQTLKSLVSVGHMIAKNESAF